MTNHFSRLEPYELAISGLVYAAPFYLELSGNQTVNLQIKTGATTAMVLNYHISSSAEPLKMTAIETPTITDGNAEVVSYKMNRQRTGNAVTKLYSNPTSVSGGTAIFYDVIGSGNHTGGLAHSGDVWVLKKNTSYVWKIEQLSNSATKVAGMLHFSEGYPSSS